jgi:hypothetical protein
MYRYCTFVIRLLIIFHISSCSHPLFKVKELKTGEHLWTSAMLLIYTASKFTTVGFEYFTVSR